MAEDEIRKHAKAAFKAVREPGKNWKHKAGEIIMEILIIIFAVTVSIWFHNWSESWKDRREEKEFFAGLKEDLKADMEEMRSDQATIRKGLRGVQYYERVGSGEEPNLDSVYGYQWVFWGQVDINPTSSRFEALKGSGKLDIIEDKNLLLHIIDLYTKDFPQVSRINNYFISLKTNTLTPIIHSHVQMKPDGGITNWKEMLRLPQMRLAIAKMEGYQQGVDAYNAAIAKCTLIIKEIDSVGSVHGGWGDGSR